MPLRETDSIKRLKEVERSIQNQSNSSLPIFLPSLAVLESGIPAKAVFAITKLFGYDQHSTIIASFPGPKEEIGIFHNCTLDT
jgi:hypothetical protein